MTIKPLLQRVETIDDLQRPEVKELCIAVSREATDTCLQHLRRLTEMLNGTDGSMRLTVMCQLIVNMLINIDINILSTIAKKLIDQYTPDNDFEDKLFDFYKESLEEVINIYQTKKAAEANAKTKTQ